MLFNSYEFIFLFLPVTFCVYFFLSKNRLLFAARVWLLLSSLFFYSWWEVRFLPVILLSIGVNYTFGAVLSGPKRERASQKAVLWAGVTFNLLLLGFYKYSDFLASTLNQLFGAGFPLMGLNLPLGISFFTFTQIAFLVDAYRGETKELRWENYSLFVAFFPHLLAGPIVHHSKVMPQFSEAKNHVIRSENLFFGLFYFLTGLFQKVVIADFFGPIADAGFSNASLLTCVEAWGALFSYALRIYFDFAGYSNMAIGLALFFNIRFPVNFNSPYQAVSIVDFWKRWHITLSNFLRDYLYIPLGGNRKGHARRYLSILVTMLLGGLWHGAGWTFVLWGAYHGCLIVLNHTVARRWTPPRPVSAAVTFLLVCYGWVLFRASDLAEALAMTRALAGLHGVQWGALPFLRLYQMAAITAALGAAFVLPNTEFWAKKIKPDARWFAVFAVLWAATALLMNRASAFLYFQF